MFVSAHTSTHRICTRFTVCMVVWSYVRMDVCMVGWMYIPVSNPILTVTYAENEFGQRSQVLQVR
jgi:hypothetical protein